MRIFLGETEMRTVAIGDCIVTTNEVINPDKENSDNTETEE